jgi:DNA replication protein DnaC
MEEEDQAQGLRDVILPWVTIGRKKDFCDDHGEFESYKLGNKWSGCDKCSENAALELAVQEGRKTKREAWEQKVRGAGIPQRFTTRTLDTFVADTDKKITAKTWATEYAKDFPDVSQVGRSAIFIGRPGTGKTHLACGIGLRVMGLHHATVVFTTVQRLMRRIKETWARNADETESQAISTFTSPELLILDEVGVQFGSETEKQLMFDILNERYENCKPCILLSNLNLTGVKEYLGDRIMDRMKENGGMTIVFDWESHRK